MSTGIQLKVNPAILVLSALIGTLAVAIISFAFIAVGRGNPSLVGYGLVSTSLFAFLLTIQVSRGKSETKEEFVKKGSVRTAIVTSLTVAYLMLIAFGLDPSQGLNLNNGILANFHIVYIFTMGAYFLTASLERIIDLLKGRSSLFS
ncbi:MAG TPA: hypothetical protein VFE98_05820 [Candidatus Bathyarchaeia archaeon]|nr:hypothetical protein [Candidatus Bathyarchaeia archaeon]